MLVVSSHTPANLIILSPSNITVADSVSGTGSGVPPGPAESGGRLPAAAFLDVAQLPDAQETTAQLDGDSLMPLLHGEDAKWKDVAISDYCSEGACQPMRMAVGGGWKYVYVDEEGLVPELVLKDLQWLGHTRASS